MQVVFEKKNGLVRFRLGFDPYDRKAIARADRSNYGPFREEESPAPAYTISDELIHFRNPAFTTEAPIHPDLIGICSVLLALPFAAREIRTNTPVSEQFSEEIYSITGRRVIPVDPSLRPREFSGDGRSALLFSGGADSFAALSFLRQDTVLVNLKRTVFAEGKDLKNFSADGMVSAMEYAKRSGFSVYTVESDLELILEPSSLPTHQSISVPAILLADVLGIDSLAYGTILEAAFSIAKGSFKEIKKGSNFDRIGRLYSTVGLSYNPVTIALSEVGTSIVVERQGSSGAAISCPRAAGGKPCMVCIKCFRKELLKCAIVGKSIPAELWDRFASSPIIFRSLSSRPTPLANVYAWVFDRLAPTSHPFESLLRDWFESDRFGLSWMERYYEGALAWLPESLQETQRAKLSREFLAMSPREVDFFQTFRNKDHAPEEYDEFIRNLGQYQRKK